MARNTDSLTSAIPGFKRKRKTWIFPTSLPAGRFSETGASLQAQTMPASSAMRRSRKPRRRLAPASMRALGTSLSSAARSGYYAHQCAEATRAAPPPRAMKVARSPVSLVGGHVALMSMQSSCAETKLSPFCPVTLLFHGKRGAATLPRSLDLAFVMRRS